MGRFWLAIIACLLSVTCVSAKQCYSERTKLEMMSSVVDVYTGDGGGAGVIVSMKKTKRNVTINVITNYHIVGHLLVGEGDPNGDLRTYWTAASVEIYEYNTDLVRVRSMAYEATVGEVDPINYLAILSLTYPIDALTKNFKIYPTKFLTTAVRTLDRVIAIGSGNGERPFPTEGIVSNPDARLNDLDGPRVIHHSAQTIFGNSGGGLFRCDVRVGSYRLAGIATALSMVDVEPPTLEPTFSGLVGLLFSGARPLGQVPVTHMSYAVPADQIIDFLTQAKVPFQ